MYMYICMPMHAVISCVHIIFFRFLLIRIKFRMQLISEVQKLVDQVAFADKLGTVALNSRGSSVEGALRHPSGA